MGKLRDLTGQRFGRLLVTKLTDHRYHAGWNVEDILTIGGRANATS